jgi:hypothetical protein
MSSVHASVPKPFPNPPYTLAYPKTQAANKPLCLSVSNAVPTPQRRVWLIFLVDSAIVSFYGKENRQGTVHEKSSGVDCGFDFLR